MNRPFGIRNLRSRGWPKERTLVVRDLVYNLYAPADPPYVSEAEAQALMSAYIEAFFGASVHSGDVLAPWYHAHPNGVVPDQ